MPNRILRDWTDSKAINELTWEAEVVFTRLIMKADDYGKYYADPILLKSLLFPRRETVSSTAIKGWLTEIMKSGLIQMYITKKGDEFLKIIKFNQRLRQMKSSFPDPDDGKNLPMSAYGGQTSAECQPETREGNEVETETKKKRGRGEMQPPAREEVFEIFKTLMPKLTPEYDQSIRNAETKCSELFKTKKNQLNGKATKSELEKLTKEHDHEFLKLAAKRGKIVGDMSDLFFSHYESTDWTDKHGNEIKNVNATAEKWILRQKSFDKKK